MWLFLSIKEVSHPRVVSRLSAVVQDIINRAAAMMCCGVCEAMRVAAFGLVARSRVFACA